MNTAVLISINPKWCELIVSGKKTIEVRKTAPKEFFQEYIDEGGSKCGEYFKSFKCYIYCTGGKQLWLCDITCSQQELLNGKVIGEFVCDRIECFTTDYRADEEQNKRISEQSCLSLDKLREYELNAHCLYGWHISNLQIYDIPKELNTFKKYKRTCRYNDLGLAIPKCDDCKDCQLTKPPMSWYYVEELKNANTVK